MPRRVQDIVPNNHRSIRDIQIERNTISAPIEPPKKRSVNSVVIKKPEISIDDSQPKRISVTPPKFKKRRRLKIWILLGIILAVAGAGYVASVYFSRASFTLVPKTIPISVNSTYIAQNTPGKSALTYEIAAVKGSVSATVPAIDGPAISTTAKGKVTLYNLYSTQPQRLVAGTRLTNSSGNIYRLTSSITIPGYTVANGTNVPGTLITTVTADKAGQEYNITRSDPSEFTIVAYKGTARYDTVYARLSSDIIGGFVGMKKTISPSILASTTAQLQSKLTTELLSQIKGTIPSGYIMYPNAYTTSFSAPQIEGNDPKSATIVLSGNLYGIIFNSDELVKRIAGEDAVAMFNEFKFTTPGLEALDFSISNQKDFSVEKKNTLIIKLKGEALLVGTIPADEIASKLAGLSLSDTSGVLKSYKPVIDIEKSSGQITPPWANVPTNTANISIEILTK